ncbi:MAG: Fe-S metabolism protein SufE [Flavobacteriales bacterium]|nr:Fe-S metabolism protein SufE [Flavobacteriales bacterium]|tara:strand:- start:7174 stop:7587 length:414 start_codon:yes stop_codon:yes gene_type:complete
MREQATQIIEEFSFLNSWEEKYEYLIGLGAEIPELDSSLKVDGNLMRGCQSKVWLISKYNNGKLYFYGDSDALITKGLVALVLRLYSNATAGEIINTELDVFEKIGLKKHLSMNRANGLNIMIETIRKHAVKYLKNE